MVFSNSRNLSNAILMVWWLKSVIGTTDSSLWINTNRLFKWQRHKTGNLTHSTRWGKLLKILVWCRMFRSSFYQSSRIFYRVMEWILRQQGKIIGKVGDQHEHYYIWVQEMFRYAVSKLKSSWRNGGAIHLLQSSTFEMHPRWHRNPGYIYTYNFIHQLESNHSSNGTK